MSTDGSDRLRRAVRQMLADLGAAGLAELPRDRSAPVPSAETARPAPPAPRAAAAPVAPPSRASHVSPGALRPVETRPSNRDVPPPVSNPPASVAPRVPEGPSVPRRPSPAPVSSAKSGRLPSEGAAPPPPALPNTAPSTATREERVAVLEACAVRVAACLRCEALCHDRTRTVFGVGDPAAKILFLGEAPGADEDRQGIPFVGRAGQLLDQIIAASKLRREDLYICNVLKCRPPDNRTPEPDEAANCREYLDEQLRTVDPDYIVCWGGTASRYLLETKDSVGRLRGRFHAYGRAKVLVTYHPSYLLRNPPSKRDVWEDMKFLMADLGVVL